jgi:hypothetical protein
MLTIRHPVGFAGRSNRCWMRTSGRRGWRRRRELSLSEHRQLFANDIGANETDVDVKQIGGDGCISLRTGTGTASGWAA